MRSFHARLNTCVLSTSTMAAILCLATIPQAAIAAPAADELQAAVETSGAQRDGIGDIIVTAQRREQRLQDVPISVAVISGDTLQERSVRNLADFSNYVPNLSISRLPGATQIIMRGVGTGPGSPSIDQSVAMFIDGVYYGHARQFDAPMVDVERVEVLRGPQGALVGRNTSAGALNIIARQPSRNFEGFADASYDFVLKAAKLEGGATIPINEQLSIRVAGKVSSSDGWLRNTVTNTYDPRRNEYLGRMTLGYDDGDLTAALKVEFQRVASTGGPASKIVAPSIGRPLDFTQATGDSIYGAQFDNVNAQNISLNITKSLGDLTLTSTTAYSAYQSTQALDADLFERDLAYSTFEENYKQYSQEFRLASEAGGRFEWATGLYGQTDRMIEERTTNVTTAANANTYRLFPQDGDVVSLYAQATFRLSPQFWLIGGARETYQRKSASFTLYSGNDVIHLKSAVGPIVRTFNDRLTEWQFDPSASLQYRPNNNLMFYASYGAGSKSGGFQGAIANAIPSTFRFDNETSRSFELGMKASAPGLGYINVAVFDTVYNKLQLSTLLPSLTAGVFATFTSNAGDAKVRGVEIDGQIRVAKGFTISGNASYVPRAEYGTYVDATCYTGRPPTNPTTGACDLSGARLPFAPELTVNITPTLVVPFGSLEGKISFTYQHRSGAFTDSTNDPLMIQPAFDKIDARVSFGSVGGGWELALLGRNLTDVATSPYGSAAPFAANPTLGIAPDARLRSVDLPRTVALQASLRF